MRLCSLLSFFLFACSLAAQTETPVLSKAVDAIPLSAASPSATIDLRSHFSYPGVTTTVVQFDSNKGVFNAVLLTNDAPRTTTNFLSYVSKGAYANSLIHRLSRGFVIQGGGFVLSGNTINAIISDAPVANEFKISNTRGTIAMAKTDLGPDTATNQWFVNLADNSANLNSQNGGFTVFARVISDGMQVVDSIAALTAYNASTLLGAPFNELPLKGPDLTAENLIVCSSIKVVPLFPENASDASVVKFTASSSNSAIATATVSGSQLGVNRVSGGIARITVTATDSNGRQGNTSFDVGELVSKPVVEMQPIGVSLPAGATLALNVGVPASAGAQLQWMRNGVVIPGATQGTLVVEGMSSALAGDYTVSATNAAGTTLSSAATVTLASSSLSLIKALAVRTYLDASQRLIVGYITSGAREVLLTGIGPGMASAALPLASCLPDPKIEIYNGSGAKIAENNDAASDLAAAIQRIRFTPLGSIRDSALLQTLQGGHMTHLFGEGAGIGLTEVYDGGTGMAGRLTAISARSYSGKDARVLIAGFVLEGDCAKTVIIRGVGPSLPEAVPNRMADPVLELYNLYTGAKISVNEDWSSGIEPVMLRTMGNGAKFTSSKDAALLVTLPPGAYSALIKGANQTEGEAVVEIYEVQ